MKLISKQAHVEQYQARVREMTYADLNRSYEFNDQWVRQQGWKLFPMEDASHFSTEEIAALYPVLRGTGYSESIAVATDH